MGELVGTSLLYVHNKSWEQTFELYNLMLLKVSNDLWRENINDSLDNGKK